MPRPEGPLPVALVMTSFAPGGTERQMIELVRRLDRDRWAVHVVSFHTRGAWFERVADVAPVVVFPVRSFRRIRETATQLRAFATWCRHARIAVVHTVDLPGTIFGLPGAACAGVPVRIANRRDIDPGRRLWKRAAQRAAYGLAHVVVANSRAVADRLRAERVPAHKIALIPNALTLPLPAPRPSPPAATGRGRVVTVANLRPEKGYDVLIDAAPQIIARCPEATFRAVGSGPELARLMAAARERNVASSFTFCGHSDDIAGHLGTADVFVLPSRSEALPNALLEAMAAGLPTVASAVGGIPELIAHDATGLLVPPADPAALADAVCRLLLDETLARRLGEEARQSVWSRPSIDDMVAAFDRLYASQLARRAAG